MTITTSPALSSTTREELELFYQFEQKTEILKFLKEYPGIISTLLQARDRIRHYFPDNALILEYHPDPEIPSDRQLVLKILTEGESEAEIERSLETEEQLARDWYLDLPEQIREIFCFSVE